MKAIEQYVHVLLFMLYKMVLTFQFVDKKKPLCVTIQMKAIEQFFHAVLFNIPYEVVLMLMSVDELKYVQQHFILPLLIKLELIV